MSDLPPDSAIALELTVLLAQPQPNWSLLLKVRFFSQNYQSQNQVLGMKNCKLLKLILDLSLENFSLEIQQPAGKTDSCGIFLCSSDGTCKNVDTSVLFVTPFHYYDLIASATTVVLSIGNNEDYSDILFSSICMQSNWAKCFDRRNVSFNRNKLFQIFLKVWNQIRPPWYESILNLVKPLLSTITKTVVNAIQTGASMYQAMLIILGSYSQLWDCVDSALPRVASLIQDMLPADIIPLNHSALIQILISALYTELLHQSELPNKHVKFTDSAVSPTTKQTEHKKSVTSFDGTLSSYNDIALAVAESLCSIDEDNKHTDQIEEFLEQVKDNLDFFEDGSKEGSSKVEETEQVTEVLVSDILMTTHGKKSLKVKFSKDILDRYLSQ